jgi:hypothetical protein
MKYPLLIITHKFILIVIFIRKNLRFYAGSGAITVFDTFSLYSVLFFYYLRESGPITPDSTCFINCSNILIELFYIIFIKNLLTQGQ